MSHFQCTIFSFQPLTPDMLIQHMLELVNAVHQITTLPKTIIRLLLDHFKWDKDILIEQYFEHSSPRHFVKSTILPTLVDNHEDMPSLVLRAYTEGELLHYFEHLLLLIPDESSVLSSPLIQGDLSS